MQATTCCIQGCAVCGNEIAEDDDNLVWYHIGTNGKSIIDEKGIGNPILFCGKCYSAVIWIDDEPHILIEALRKAHAEAV